jgi:hypothetical protein
MSKANFYQTPASLDNQRGMVTKNMIDNNNAVASVDASVDIHQYIEGLGQLVEEHIKHGFEPYMLSFMFKLAMLNGRSQQLHEEVNRVYSRFLTECVRNPWSKHNLYNRPVLIACPDWPVPKRYKQDQIKMLPWEGAHWGGVLLVPPRNNLNVGVKDHFETVKRKAYVRAGLPLSRVHVEHISYQRQRATEYVLKSLTRRRCNPDDLLICPLSTSERPK